MAVTVIVNAGGDIVIKRTANRLAVTDPAITKIQTAMSIMQIAVKRVLLVWHHYDAEMPVMHLTSTEIMMA
jgi:hypothetical protein